jgi:DNA-binding beta-propeller fold protein YncE
LIDSKTNNVITTIPVGSNSTSLEYNYDNGMAYVINSNMFE